MTSVRPTAAGPARAVQLDPCLQWPFTAVARGGVILGSSGEDTLDDCGIWGTNRADCGARGDHLHVRGVVDGGGAAATDWPPSRAVSTRAGLTAKTCPTTPA